MIRESVEDRAIGGSTTQAGDGRGGIRGVVDEDFTLSGGSDCKEWRTLRAGEGKALGERGFCASRRLDFSGNCVGLVNVDSRKIGASCRDEGTRGGEGEHFRGDRCSHPDFEERVGEETLKIFRERELEERTRSASTDDADFRAQVGVASADAVEKAVGPSGVIDDGNWGADEAAEGWIVAATMVCKDPVGEREEPSAGEQWITTCKQDLSIWVCAEYGAVASEDP